jgi:hypothetical protein
MTTIHCRTSQTRMHAPYQYLKPADRASLLQCLQIPIHLCAAPQIPSWPAVHAPQPRSAHHNRTNHLFDGGRSAISRERFLDAEPETSFRRPLQDSASRPTPAGGASDGAPHQAPHLFCPGLMLTLEPVGTCWEKLCEASLRRTSISSSRPATKRSSGARTAQPRSGATGGTFTPSYVTNNDPTTQRLKKNKRR